VPQIKTKFLEDNAVSGAKVRLANEQPLRSRDVADINDVELIRLNGNDIRTVPGNLRIDGSLLDSAESTSYDVAARQIVDSGGNISVDAEAHTLYDPDETVALDFSSNTGFSNIKLMPNSSTLGRGLEFVSGDSGGSTILRGKDVAGGTVTFSLPSAAGNFGGVLQQGATDGDGVNWVIDNNLFDDNQLLSIEIASRALWDPSGNTIVSWATTDTLEVIANTLKVPTTITGGGTTGAQTINKMAGTVNFAAAATSLVVTNSLVSTSSIVMAVVRTNDATAVIKNVVPAAGSFTINLNAAATAETSVGFFVIN
jgi:hypothetical protein